MSIKRKLPNSDKTFSKVIRKAYARLAIVSSDKIPFRATTIAFLTAFIIVWNEAMKLRSTTLAAQTSATALVEQDREDLKVYINHFIQVFNLGIKRKIYTKEQRSYYTLATGREVLPSLNTDDKLLLWGERIVNGDARRIANGGRPMANPSAAEVNTLLLAYQLSSGNQARMILAHQNASTAVVDLRPDAKKLCLKIYDESNAHYNHLPASTKRQMCRPWGVRYMSNVIVRLHILVINKASRKAVGNSSIFLNEMETSHTADYAGRVTISTSVTDMATLITSNKDFKTEITEVPLDAAVSDYEITIELSAKE